MRGADGCRRLVGLPWGQHATGRARCASAKCHVPQVLWVRGLGIGPVDDRASIHVRRAHRRGPCCSPGRQPVLHFVIRPSYLHATDVRWAGRCTAFVRPCRTHSRGRLCSIGSAPADPQASSPVLHLARLPAWQQFKSTRYVPSPVARAARACSRSMRPS